MGSGPCAKGWPCTRPSSKTPKSACALAAVQIRIFDDLSRVGFLKIFVYLPPKTMGDFNMLSPNIVDEISLCSVLYPSILYYMVD